ncbi:unnamed protein product [Peniophora sp. CBMAI 1063]|nr:unnamed protein product [Peniophora sp. CBMAI 1063]
MEQMLIARVRHNACVLKVQASGQYKLRANAVMFAVPTPKLYQKLPPKREEFEELIAFIFIGPTKPTEDMHRRLPSFVRRNKVRAALEWLKLNHCDYSDLDISYENLNEYPEEGPPVIADWRLPSRDIELENKAVFEMEDWTSVEEDYERLKRVAKAHLLQGGHAIAVGRSAEPETIYNNPQLYPKCFPWLFPYGLGGVGNKNGHSVVGDVKRKRALLLYHDKRFQRDPVFALVALNHEQVKSSTTGSFVTAKKGNFSDIADRILKTDVGAMDDVIRKLEEGGQFDLANASEKSCFNLINDLDFVGRFVQGSRTNKRHMRNEIWSLIAARGAPSWFVTFAPMDHRHPLSVYYAAEDKTLFPQILDDKHRAQLIGNNATACARFFKFMVESFIKHVLRIDGDSPGLFGDTEGYYGTVEEQGRLTLHLHTMIWIKGALTPQQIRDRLMSKDGDFQRSLVDYLEGAHRGSYLTGVNAEMEDRWMHAKHNRAKRDDPTINVPKKPPRECAEHVEPSLYPDCVACRRLNVWNSHFAHTVDEVVHRYNLHNCARGHCRNPRYPECKARFPREISSETTVDQESGWLKMKHGEPMVNTYNEVLTYMMMSNTDVTSLLSGTALKAVIAYTTDYITKPGLRTHTMMEIIKSVFTRNSEYLQGTTSRAEKARKLMVQIVNALTVKQEIGSPMACAYLLGHPDHYTNYKFRPFYWRMFVGEVKRVWGMISEDDRREEPVVVLARGKDSVVALSPIIDYNLRGEKLKDMSLYDWMRSTVKEKIPKRKKKANSLERDSSPADDRELRDPQNADTLTQGMRGSRRARGKVNNRTGSSSALEATVTNSGNHDPLSQQTLVDDENADEDGYQTDSTLIADDDLDEDYEVEDSDDERDEERDQVRRSRSKNSVLFTKDHPQRDSYRIRVLDEDACSIPNFVGGTLPRRDKGDVEWYAMTMLTMFKPWRDPKELKSAEQTWQEAFEAFEFTARQREIMGFFHIRYECNDARDDFRAQRVSQAKNDGLHWLGGRFVHELDKEAHAEHGLALAESSLSSIDDAFEPDHLGNRAAANSLLLARTRIALDAIGWSDVLSRQKSGDEPIMETGEEEGPSCHRKDEAIDVDSRTLKGWQELLATKRAAVLAEKQAAAEAASNGLSTAADKSGDSFWKDQVRIVDHRYMTSDYRSEEGDIQAAMDKIVKDFSLNSEQERAFRIIANHASLGTLVDPLKMYIGGMAGTGKSQVIKALIAFFEARGKKYAFLILAPTGSAAALVSGSTYHSVLGFRGSNSLDHESGERSEGLLKGASTLESIRQRIKHVDYVFFDEVSMMDCGSLYNISSQMNLAMRIDDDAFAGKSIIFAGDFAQLPPLHTSGPTLYSSLVSSVIHTTNSATTQKRSIGKALWHQVTVVVMLKENMRQRNASEEDIKFRKLLVNLRMNRCDREDIELMHSRVARPNHPDIDLNHPDFVHASMITCRNVNRDLLNEIGSYKFAHATNQELTTFYAVDAFSNSRAKKDKSTLEHNPKRAGVLIPDEQANKILQILPGNTSHIPGKLSLCKNMPVILKKNDATELNVTNGAEGTVYTWKSRRVNDKNVLDVLFVKLTNPPTEVKLDGLPTNVVPVCRQKAPVTVKFPDDTVLSITRDQVPVLPNFAMTDYASQGRTRPINIVDLEDCRTHQSVYTCLSRASTIKGTVIFRMCSLSKVTGGLSGYLRQEFRELELLSEITRLRWEGTLKPGVGGNTRSTLLRSYLRIYGQRSCPDHVHSELKWSNATPIVIDYDDDDNFVWKTVGAAQSVPNEAGSATEDAAKKNDSRKRKRADPVIRNKMDIVEPAAKKKRTSAPEPFRGMAWDSSTQSCAYDSALTIFLNIYNLNVRKWQDVVHVNEIFTEVVNYWRNDLVAGTLNQAELARESLQTRLNLISPDCFPNDGRPTDLTALLQRLLEHPGGNMMTQVTKCGRCQREGTDIIETPVWMIPAKAKSQTLAAEIKQRFSRASNRGCEACTHTSVSERVLLNPDNPPPFLALLLEDGLEHGRGVAEPKLQNQTTVTTEDGKKVVYKTRGLIYSGNNHFCVRLIGRNGAVYYNDGATTAERCIPEGKLTELDDPYVMKGRRLRFIILSIV